MKINLDIIKGMKVTETYTDGTVKACTTTEYNSINSPAGLLVPQFTEEFSYFQRRKKYRPSMIFHSNGWLKSMALEEQIDVKTPLGTFPAELVTFYDDGSLNRVFPLNGQIDGYWSEEEEGEYAEPYTFDLEIGKITTKIVSLRFDKKGGMKSLTFWPGTELPLATPIGEVLCKNGFALYAEGQLKSTEPAKPTVVKTPVGSVLAYDPEALGIHADSGSLGFHEDGSLRTVTTVVSTFDISDSNGKTTHIGAREIESFTGEDETQVIPVKAIFDEDQVSFDNGERHVFDLNSIEVKIGISPLTLSGCSDCSSCSGCS